MIMSDLNIIKSVDMILSFIIQPINGSNFIKCCAVIYMISIKKWRSK